MTPEELRLECLKLVLQSANASGMPVEVGQLISRARTYADFVMNWRAEGAAASVGGVQNLELALEKGLQRHRPPGSEDGRALGAG